MEFNKNKIKFKIAISKIKEENEVMNKENNKIKFISKYGIKFAMAMAVLTFIALPNISPQISYAMQEMPIVGNIIKVITIRNYFDEDGNSELDLEIPNVENIDGSQSKSNNAINEEVNKLTQRIIDNYYEEKNPDNHKAIKLESDVIENNENWFTLKLSIFETAGSSNIEYKYYHIDKKANKIVTLSDLFINSKYKTAVSEEIKKQMKERMSNDEQIIYWLNDDIEESNFKEIKDNQNFYFSKDNNIVIVFNKYEVGPGSIGVPEFEINKEIYAKYLK